MQTTNGNATSLALETHVAEIVSAYLAKNQIAPSDLPGLITSVYEALRSLGKAPEPEPLKPAVPIRQSVTRDYVVCLECGWRGFTLGRHLSTRHGLTRNEYRARWKLPRNHALTAPAYSERRSEMAKNLGLGRRAGRGRRRRARSRPTPSTT
jgi:MucR family transcriptional regulator, transcriptional regulator of exopolysaccharide biosynthesis